MCVCVTAESVQRRSVTRSAVELHAEAALATSTHLSPSLLCLATALGRLGGVARRRCVHV